MIFVTYDIILLVATILLAVQMLVKGNIDVAGIIILIVISFFDVFMVAIVCAGINITNN
ncbi:MAG: hypothetical protein H7Y18_18705 [Clostridiaceae bacterium]|nr:hypothetical protein [Clostridiaceae bacterium]